MAPEGDPDLALLVKSFNDMADAVQTRFEREARFASDVSHELRSPITALSAAVEVLDARRADLPERTQQALDVVVGQVRRFDQMVMDLLELSRIDAGSTELLREEVDIEELVTRIAAALRLRRDADRDRPEGSQDCARRQAAIRADPRQPARQRTRACRWTVASRRSNHTAGTESPCRSTTPARESRAVNGLASSNASPVAARPATVSAPASGWRSSSNTPTPTAAKRGSRIGPGGGARFKVSFAEVA